MSPAGPRQPSALGRWALAAALSMAPACAPEAGDAEARDPEPPRRVAVRVGPGSPLAALFESHPFVARLRERGGVEVEVGPDAAGEVVVEAGLTSGTGALGSRLSALPIRIGPGVIELSGRRYAAPEHVLALRLPDGDGRHWVVLGHEAEPVVEFALRALFRRVFPRRGRELEAIDYVLHESPYLLRSGRWRRSADGRYEVDPAHDDDPIARRDASWSGRSSYTGVAIRLRDAPQADATATVDLLRDLDEAAIGMAGRLGRPLEPPVEVWVEDDYEAIGRHLGEVAPAVLHHHGDAWDVHLVEHASDRFHHRYVIAQALLARSGIAGDRPWLRDGAALALSGEWYGRPFRDWLPVLAAGRVLPLSAELLARERQGDATDVLWAPVAAGVLERLPGAGLEEKLRAAEDPARVDAALADLASLADLAPPSPEPRGWRLGFQAGVSLAMSPGLERGYHAAGYFDVLRHLEGMGADAVSVMPMASQRDPERPVMAFMRRGAGSEHDLALVEGVRRARARGFQVLYKPHVWVGRGSWPGDIAMTSESDWRLWWRSYRRYVLHHAVLAAFSGAEIFAVGTELGRTLERESDWRHLIGSVRRVFPGHVTYAGNWWGDYDRIPFADALDAVGVDAYFPLSKDPDASDAALAAGAREAVAGMRAVAERFGRPLLLTEVGFSAQRASWIAPHEEGRFGDRVFENHQSRAYAALLGALGRPDWLAGVYPWKVMSSRVPPTEESTAGRGDPDFEFLGRPAEAVVARYLSRMPDSRR